MHDSLLYEQIQNTLIIPDHTKQDILKYFDKFSEKQKIILTDLIKSENYILLDFLKEQKENGSIPISEMKWEYIKYRQKKRQEREKIEQEKEEKELESLLDGID